MFESQLFACRGFFYLLLHYKTIVNKSVEKNRATKLLSTNLLKQLNNNQNLLDRGSTSCRDDGPVDGLD